MYTKGKWKVKREADWYSVCLGDDEEIARLELCENNESNAQRIIQCVNSHDDLVEACKLSLFHFKLKYKREVKIIDKLQQAINKAEEK